MTNRIGCALLALISVAAAVLWAVQPTLAWKPMRSTSGPQLRGWLSHGAISISVGFRRTASSSPTCLFRVRDAECLGVHLSHYIRFPQQVGPCEGRRLGASNPAVVGLVVCSALPSMDTTWRASSPLAPNSEGAVRSLRLQFDGECLARLSGVRAFDCGTVDLASPVPFRLGRYAGLP